MSPARKLGKKLRILVSNDDGIHAPGLAVAEKIARTMSDDIWVVAPETEQSGASHSLTLTLPLRQSIDVLRTQLAELGRAAATAAGIDAQALNVFVDDVTPDAATFRIDFPTARTDAAIVKSRIRENVIAAAQLRGWLPGGPAGAAATTATTATTATVPTAPLKTADA